MKDRYRLIQRDNTTMWLADLINCQVLGKYANISAKAEYYTVRLNDAYRLHDNEQLQRLYDNILEENYAHQKGKLLSEVQKGDLVIWKQNAACYTTEIVQDTYKKTHILVQNRKFRRSDGREVGVREGTTEWIYCKIMQFNQRILDDEEYIRQHTIKINAIHTASFAGKMFSRDVDEIYQFLKVKGIIE